MAHGKLASEYLTSGGVLHFGFLVMTDPTFFLPKTKWSPLKSSAAYPPPPPPGDK